jgi:acyl-Coa thioesterase superfamily protein
VQLTARLRARPAPGWLRIEARSTAVAGGWFDADATVVDSAGRLVCQARQLALSPLPS